jgi:hypothetical protein
MSTIGRGLALVVMIASAGCGDDGGSVAGDAQEETVDVLSVDTPPLAPCPAMASSSAKTGGKTYGFAALGNVDVGGESNCGGPHEAIRLVFSLAADSAPADQLAIGGLMLPVTTGPRSVMIYTDAGTVAGTATLDVTSVMLEGAGPDLAQLTGTLTGYLKGSFTASHCPQLDVTCI